MDYGPMFRALIPPLLYWAAVLLALTLPVYAFRQLRARFRRKKLARLGIAEIDALSGRDFEYWVAAIWERQGWKVRETPYCGDWGADVIVERHGKRAVIQAKRWRKRVGVRAVQEIVAAKAKYRADKAIVVTNSTYTPQAQKLADDVGVTLYGRSWLLDALCRLDESSRRDAA